MKNIIRARWLSAALVSSIALVGANASAVQAVLALLNIDPSNNQCSNPPGEQIAARAEGFGTQGASLCMVESTGTTTTGNCFPAILDQPTTFKAFVGTVNLTTMEFTDQRHSLFVNWSTNGQVTSPSWSVSANCSVSGTAFSRN